MLLTCDRHTPADREYWSELEAADRMHFDCAEVGRKGDAAAESLRAFASSGPCYVATSWGKDSLVVAHLLAMSGLTLSLVHVAQSGPLQDPYQSAVRGAFLACFPSDYHEITVPGDNRIADDGGRAPQLEVGIRLAAERFGTRRYVSGLRADESGVRKIRARAGLPTGSCWPLCWWTADDVFAWVAYYELPLHPAYGMTGGGRWDRRHIRVSTIGGPKGSQFGRHLWEQEYYGDVLRRLQASHT